MRHELPGRTTIAAAMLLLASSTAFAALRAGVGVGDITPPVGTPSAGYGDRQGAGMEGVHDRLLATALAIDNGDKVIVLAGVDHLGFDHEMVEEIRAGLPGGDDGRETEIYVSSSHTHAGGGAFMDIPGLGQILAGTFDPAVRRLYVDGTVAAILAALDDLQPARIGIGHGAAPELNAYRGDWPPNVEPRAEVTVIKVVDPREQPLAVWFHYPAHATVLPGRANMQFSADFVGAARDALVRELGSEVVAVYCNGAQGDVSPRPPGGDEMWERVTAMGEALAAEVLDIWNDTETKDSLGIETSRHAYDLEVQPTSSGTKLPFDRRSSELNLIVLDQRHAFLTVPGELSTIYDHDLARFGGWLGYEHTTILGLTNDAQGYIITPESWRHRTYESTVSFGGETYGELLKSKLYALLHELEPEGAYQEDEATSSVLLAEPATP